MKRRDLLRNAVGGSALGLAASAASASDSVGSASVQRSVPEGDIEITGMTGVSPDAVTEDVRAILSQKDTDTLTKYIKEKTGFELDTELAIGINLKSDDKELNAHNPRVVHLALRPAVNSDNPALNRKPSVSEFSPDNGGAILAATVEQGGERTLVGLWGVTRQKSQHGQPGAHSLSRGTVDTKSFVVNDGSTTIHQKSTGDQPMKDKLGAFRDNKSAITTQDSPFTCWGCATVVGVACAGAATLSYSSCVSAAITSGAFSPLAGATIGVFCTYIVSNAGTLSCAAGTAAICAGVSNDCQFLEDEI